MKTHDFILGPVDTDSISFCKPDMSPFTKEEQKQLIDEINSIMPEYIQYSHDGYFPSVLVIKAKNYVLQDEDGKIKTKGSALKATMKEARLKDFINNVILYLLSDKKDEVVNLYNQYVKEIYNLKSIDGWTLRKTITSKVLDPQRINEQKVLDAIEDEELQEGDKVYLYFDKENKLVLQDKWNNDHNTEKLVKKLYDTLKVFSTVLDMTQYTKYHLKSHDIKIELYKVLGLPEPIKEKKTRKKKIVEVDSQIGYN